MPSLHQSNLEKNAPKSEVVSIDPDAPTDVLPRIEALTVLTDSVVGSVIVTVSDETRRIIIYWGDGTTDVINNRPGIEGLAAPGTNPLPKGTYKRQHAYSLSEDGRGFNRLIVVRTEDADGTSDISQTSVRVVPRWRVTHYPMRVALLAACDPFWVRDLTIFVTLSRADGTIKKWNWHVSNNFIAPELFTVLPDSGWSMEYVRPEAEGPFPFEHNYFSFVEKDFGPDDYASIDTHLHYHGGELEGNFSEIVEEQADTQGGCKIMCRYGRDVKLLIPIEQQSGWTFVT